jgi:hypothetical protein
VFNVESDSPSRIPLVAFAHSPHDSRSACVAVLDEVTEPEADVAKCRSVGAPLVFVTFNDQWQFWKQGTTRPELVESLSQPELANFFRTKHTEFAPTSVYRAKTWARLDRNYQLSFVDLGLMPLIEEQAGRKLSGLIERVVIDTKLRLGWHDISDEQGHWLLKASFWLLAGKILRDKRVGTFAGLDLENLDDVFARVATHYGAIERVSPGPPVQAQALRESAIEISRFSNLGLVTIEALAYLYENALITKATRTELGTHSTPTYLVDYIVGKLRPWIQELPSDERQAFEPACGHAAFLLAAMRLLSELLPANTSPSDRHDYLRARLHGCDVDPFALEIARLSLTLSDVPNPNGWHLQRTDVFVPGLLDNYLRQATIVLANPPFKVARQLLELVIERLRPGTVLGVVVPRGLLHSRGATSLRKSLATNFEIAEICLFPDKVFTFSSAESAVILARRLESNNQNHRSTLYRRIREQDFVNFRRAYGATHDAEISSFKFSADNGWSFVIPDLENVWEACKALPRFGDIATIGKGFDFRSMEDPDFPKNAIRVSTRPLEGFIEGFVRLSPELETHQLPKTVWINPDPRVIKTPRHGMTRHVPQLLLNYSPVSRGPWRLKALIDNAGHAVSSRFLAVRPKDDQWPLEALWGICNSPIANAYSYAFSSKRDVLAGVMRMMPIPSIQSNGLTTLISAVRAYRSAARNEDAILSSARSSNELRLLHWQIDVEVLRLYDLPVRLEQDILQLFSGFERRGVPFSQTAYFPREFSALPLRLRELLALATASNWDQINERRTDLIVKNVEGTITAIEQSELDDLQQLVDARIFLEAPLPTPQMEKIREDLQKRGIWEESDAIA